EPHNLQAIVTEMLEMSGDPSNLKIHENNFSNKINDLLGMMEEHYWKTVKREKEILKVFSGDELIFLRKNLFSLLEESDNDDGSNFDIFNYNRQRDSSLATSKKTMDLLSRLGKDKISNAALSNFYFCYELFKYVTKHKDELNRYYDTFRTPNKFGVTIELNDKKIIIGGKENNIYKGDYAFIIDLGGDDIYNIENKNSESGDGFSCIIDLAGNDYYTTSSDFALAGGLFSSGFIFDKEGDDFYESIGNGNLGAAIGGLGLLYDEKGNDTYKGISFSIGAGCFGVGLVVDREGNDFYIANSYSQGFGMTEGVGAIIDDKGNDSYLVDSRSLDIGRDEDHYVSMCQGYGLGFRPFYAGGIGLIIEGGGNDIYNTDIFGQGGAYWYSLGTIVDKSGHDKYNGYQYSQGAGIHLAIGLLKDYDGWDFYTSNGVSQGCGHDFGFGMLWDVKGNDNYSAFSRSQGAGNANGIGMLIDQSGVDGYLNKYPGISRGYGNPRREYGSIGIFLDASGDDYYSERNDSTIINSSAWGVMNDYYLIDLPSQLSGDNFKVPVDSVDRPHDIPFSLEQYFIMAKTIEPRFSLWQEFGFRKLIDDSIGSSGFVLTKLGTIDARETQVMRVLSQKIRNSMSDALITKFNSYLQNSQSMTQPEVSFACYIFGETRNPAGKDILYRLTFDDNYKIRASAINALGKINYDSNDTEFKNKVSSRLAELIGESSDKKLYRKDIAFAFGNYRRSENIPVLMSMLTDDFYGARFLAADALIAYGDAYFPYITGPDMMKFGAAPQYMNPFLYSLTGLSENNFMKNVKTIFAVSSSMPGLMFENVIDVIRIKRDKSIDTGFIAWSDSKINDLRTRVTLKTR